MVISLIHSTNSTILSSSQNKLQITSTSIRPPSYLKNPRVVLPNLPQLYQKQSVLEQIKNLTTIPLVEDTQHNTTTHKMQMILDFISDRIEMHQNIGEQRENWNSLLLNSINMIILTATAMSGIAGTTSEIPNLPLKVSSVLLFSAATGMLLIMNKIQPSQLVEEQRNAVRKFKQLQTRIQTHLSRQNPTQDDVDDAFERVLTLDRAYPLPLLGAMLDKFPDTFKPAVWWPVNKSAVKKSQRSDIKGQKMGSNNNNNNGWNEKLEVEMRQVLGVIKSKDIEDYERLGNKALKLNKMLAALGPLLTGVAALGSAFSGHGGPWAWLVAGAAGSMASVVNMVEHGGQVGMVFEMYRNCGGFFKLLEETVESNLEECDFDNRENGDLFEMKMALHLGRSLSELRDLADNSQRNGGVVNEFASKLF